MGTVIAVLVAVCGVYLAACLALYLRQGAIVYCPVRELTATPQDMGMAFDELWLRTADNVRLHAWFVPAVEPAPATVLFCHGNAGNMSDRVASVHVLHKLGYNVLLFDYRGFGQSEGRASEAGTAMDSTAAWQYLTEARGTPPASIIIFGRSLGGAVAARLAAEEGADAGLCIIESTFTSIPRLARERYPYFPTSFLCRYRYDSLSAVGRIRCPLLIGHSAEDAVIPYRHGRQLLDAAADRAEFLELRGPHGEYPWLATPEYGARLSEFISRKLSASRGDV